MKNEFEKRNYSFEIRAETNNNENIITGRPIVFSSRTDLINFDEVIDRGALDSADLSDVRFLVNHDVSKIPLARSKQGQNSTMNLTVDEKGLMISVKLDTENNSDARALYSAVKRGDISGMSFMFSIKGVKWENLDSDRPTRHITEIGKVVEVSAVTFPAYEETEINARSRQILEDARSDAKNINQTFKELELLKEKIKLF